MPQASPRKFRGPPGYLNFCFLCGDGFNCGTASVCYTFVIMMYSHHWNNVACTFYLIKSFSCHYDTDLFMQRGHTSLHNIACNVALSDQIHDVVACDGFKRHLQGITNSHNQWWCLFDVTIQARVRGVMDMRFYACIMQTTLLVPLHFWTFSLQRYKGTTAKTITFICGCGSIALLSNMKESISHWMLQFCMSLNFFHIVSFGTI